MRRTHRRGAPFAASLVLAFAVASTLIRPVSANGGFAVDRFDATPGGDLFFASDYPWYADPWSYELRAAIVADLADRPLTFVPIGGTGSEPLIDQMALSYVQATFALHDWLDVGLSLPVSLVQTGSSPSGVPVGPAAGVAPGDLQLLARVRLYRDAERDPFSVHLGMAAFLPTGNPGSNVGDGGFGGRIYAVLAGRIDELRWSFVGGFELRPRIDIPATGTHLGDELFASGALGYALANERLTIGPELWAATGTSGAFQASTTDAELLAGAHYELTPTWRVGLGIGLGLTQGIGTPDWRALAGLTYSTSPFYLPPPPAPILEPVPAARPTAPPGDRDHDGVPDAVDQCPETPQGPHPDPTRPGCPEPDTDGDGVLDDADQCPTTPQGAHPDPTRPGCPDGDRDGDGVPDHSDLCPNQPAGIHPDPARPGCPLPDRDGDSVPDAVDACPDTPGAPNPDPKKNGCPSTVKVENGFIVVLRPLLFQPDGDRCLPSSYPILIGVANALKATPEIKLLSIEGNTDDTGTPEHNLDLSARRARWVMRWLIKRGIAPDRLQAVGYGESRPVASNASAAGRALNRRVDFRILIPPQSQPAAQSQPQPQSQPAAQSRPVPRSQPAASRPAAPPLHRHERIGAHKKKPRSQP